MLVSDIVYAAFRLAGILPRAGRGYSSSEGSDGLKALNSLIDSWKIERLTVYAIRRTEFATVANQQEYSIGPTGADWTLERPTRLEYAGFLYTNVTPVIEQPFKILTDQEFALLSPKAMTSTLSYLIYYRPTIPNGTIFLFPKATSAWRVALYTWQTINEFAALTDTVTLPPGYRRALEYNLAMELAARFPEQMKMPLAPYTIEEARTSKGAIKRMNVVSLQMVCDIAALGTGESRGGRWNILTGHYGPAM